MTIFTCRKILPKWTCHCTLPSCLWCSHYSCRSYEWSLCRDLDVDCTLQRLCSHQTQTEGRKLCCQLLCALPPHICHAAMVFTINLQYYNQQTLSYNVQSGTIGKFRHAWAKLKSLGQFDGKWLIKMAKRPFSHKMSLSVHHYDTHCFCCSLCKSAQC